MDSQPYPSHSFNIEESQQWIKEQKAYFDAHHDNMDQMFKTMLADEFVLALRSMLTFHLQNVCVPHSDQHVAILSALSERLHDPDCTAELRKILDKEAVMCLERWEVITSEECQACLDSLPFDVDYYHPPLSSLPSSTD